jgi:hypothetical protein
MLAIIFLINGMVELLALYWLFKMLIRDMVELPDTGPGITERHRYDTGKLLMAAFLLMNGQLIVGYEDWLSDISGDMLTLSHYVGALITGLFFKWVYSAGMLYKRRSHTPDKYLLMVECVVLPLILITGWRLWNVFL